MPIINENYKNTNEEIIKIKYDYQNKNIEYLPTGTLHPSSYQPRKMFDTGALEDLAQSLRAHGILQPLIVSNDNDGSYSIVAGERRWRAAKIAGFETVPCIFRNPNEHAQLELALIENIQREELSSIEEAFAYQQLTENHGYSHDTLASQIGKSRSVISNTIRLLNLPKSIQNDLNMKVITAGHARALCSIENEAIQLKIHQAIIAKKLSVRQTEELIKNLKKEKSLSKLIDNVSPDLRYVCDLFKSHLGTKVKIAGDKSKGRIEINYYTMDDLERITELIIGDGLSLKND